MHVVIGAGEVGRAVYDVLSPHYETSLRDVEPSGPDRADVLHICFPYSSAFVDAVRLYQFGYRPGMTIIHSTVAIGTTDQIAGAVHSPVRGRHPDLAESIRTFVKYFGGERAKEAAAIFTALSVPVGVTPRAVDTEAGKLWELAQFGMAVAIEKEIYAYCERAGLDFDVVYRDFARTYNDGYTAMGALQFVRPIIDHIPGPIGGHCVVPNSRLLGHMFGEIVALAGTEELAEVPA